MDIGGKYFGDSDIVILRQLSSAQRQVAYRLAQKGALIKVWTGAYSTRPLDLYDFALAQLVGISQTTSAVIAGRSAAYALRLPSLKYRAIPQPELYVAGPGPSPIPIIRHRPLPTTGVISTNTKFGTVRVTTPGRTALDLARFHSLAEGVAALDVAIRAHQADDVPSELVTLYNSKGIKNARTAAELAKGLSESPPESFFLTALWEAGAPPPYQQADVFGPDGTFAGRPDFLWPEASFSVEFHGAAKHLGVYDSTPEGTMTREALRHRRLDNAGLAQRHIEQKHLDDGSAIRATVSFYQKALKRFGPLPSQRWRANGPRAW